MLHLNEGISLAAIATAANQMTNVRSSSVLTGAGLAEAISLFDETQGGRSADSGVARVGFVQMGGFARLSFYAWEKKYRRVLMF